MPDEVIAVPVIPRTLTGKKLEIPVKRILTGTSAEVAAGAGRTRRSDIAGRVVELARRRPTDDARVT